MYHHADQSWRSMPRLLSQKNQHAFADQLYAYVKSADIKHCVVILHGGEPLLMPRAELIGFIGHIRNAVDATVRVDISIQTNGISLTKEWIDDFRRLDVSVSLSLDGPKSINDLHRNSRKGRSSFYRAFQGLELLKDAPEIFTGIIAVIDPRTSPRELFEFFAHHSPPSLDFLLPDAHHITPPVGRQDDAGLYERWLLEAFDLWFYEFPELQIRTFEALLDVIAGLPSKTDAFGFGDVSLITVETDGTYHDLDVLKVVGDGATKLVGGVKDTAIAEAAESQVMTAHRKLLRKDGLCETCLACDVVDICGGGAVPHRYGNNGFKNPTVYCNEWKALIRHAQTCLMSELSKPSTHQEECSTNYTYDLAEFELAESSALQVEKLLESSFLDRVNKLKQVLSIFSVDTDPIVAEKAKILLHSPRILCIAANWAGVTAWSNTMLALNEGRLIHSVDGVSLPYDGNYLSWLEIELKTGSLNQIQVHRPDSWLRLPFGRNITFESDEVSTKAIPVLTEALKIIHTWRPSLAAELGSICSAIQFVRDPSADPDKIVSFSDNAVPGALFVSVKKFDSLIDPYDLADSLIHEYRHQKLYLLEREVSVVEPTTQKVVSPWREDLRPPSGLFHAVFVFVELLRFWKHVKSLNIIHLENRANNQITDTEINLRIAFETLAGCSLTPVGRALLKALREGAGV